MAKNNHVKEKDVEVNDTQKDVTVKEELEASVETLLQETSSKTTNKNNISDEQIQIKELTETLKRLQAEFENYKKRTEKENVTLIKNSNAGLIKNLLPVLDSFELAIKNNKNGTENHETEKIKKGIELIYAQLYGILTEQGLRVIDTKNKRFDPYKHEVLLVKDGKEEDNLVLEELQKGYMFNEHVLRYAKVMISKHVEDKKE